MNDIDKMTTNEWLAYREEKIEEFCANGDELKPNPDCKTCDVPNEYVCFACECHQLEMP